MIVAVTTEDNGTAVIEMESYDPTKPIDAGDLITIAANCVNIIATNSNRDIDTICEDIKELLVQNHKMARPVYKH